MGIISVVRSKSPKCSTARKVKIRKGAVIDPCLRFLRMVLWVVVLLDFKHLQTKKHPVLELSSRALNCYWMHGYLLL